MVTAKCNYRILYADTDKAGIVYYGTYPRFYEMGRAEMVREMGYTYKQMEDAGVMMPVVSVQSKYVKPLYYDELITIETTIPHIPEVRAVFQHNIYNAAGELAHIAEVTLVFLNIKSRRPTRAPIELIKLLENK